MIRFLFVITLLIYGASIQNLINQCIINGADASVPDDLSFIASIQLGYQPLISYFHICSGTIMNKYWILTTAICAKRITKIGDVRVKINKSLANKNYESQIIDIADFIVHENFTGNYWAYDISLILLKTAISNPVTANLAQSEQPQTGEVLMRGWSRSWTEFFEKVPRISESGRVLILDNPSCRFLLSQSAEIFQLQDSQMCTHLPRNFITGSDGDSGDPVIRYVDGKPEILGLLSLKPRSLEQVDTPTVSTRVSHFIDWINKKIEEKTSLT